MYLLFIYYSYYYCFELHNKLIISPSFYVNYSFSLMQKECKLLKNTMFRNFLILVSQTLFFCHKDKLIMVPWLQSGEGIWQTILISGTNLFFIKIKGFNLVTVQLFQFRTLKQEPLYKFTENTVYLIRCKLTSSCLTEFPCLASSDNTCTL